MSNCETMYKLVNTSDAKGQGKSQKSNDTNKMIPLKKDLENLHCEHDFEHEVENMSERVSKAKARQPRTAREQEVILIVTNIAGMAYMLD